jgi:hypothetical protein
VRRRLVLGVVATVDDSDIDVSQGVHRVLQTRVSRRGRGHNEASRP